MEREDFFQGISVFIFIPLILIKFIKQAFAICISEARKLAEDFLHARTPPLYELVVGHRIELELA